MIFMIGTFTFLGKDDILRADDYVRPLVDFGAWLEETVPSNEWRTVEDELPAWVGKSLQQFNDFDEDRTEYQHAYEVMRKV